MGVPACRKTRSNREKCSNRGGGKKFGSVLNRAICRPACTCYKEGRRAKKRGREWLGVRKLLLHYPRSRGNFSNYKGLGGNVDFLHGWEGLTEASEERSRYQGRGK